MKKTVITALVFLLIGAAIGYLLFFTTAKKESVTADVSGETQLIKTACTAVEYIKSGSFDKLAEMVHPEDGVYFVPYSYIDLSTDVHFTAEQVAGIGSDETDYMWGYTDGEGAPINLSPTKYFEKYVFNQDYTTAPVIGRNYIVMSGNSIENVKEVFPDCQFVDFHFPGFDEQYAGMDWCTLRIVFREYEGAYKIVAIIHAQWTI